MKLARDFFGNKDSIVIYDTEFTTWEGCNENGWLGENQHRELVQVAAQKIDLQNEKVLDSFERLIIPRINRNLSDYFIDLTHINQRDIEEKGVDFEQALEEFLGWSDKSLMFSYGKLGGLSDEVVIQENIDMYKIDTVLADERFRNVAEIFVDSGVDISAYNSGKLYQAFGLELDGHEHNAMHDVDSLVQSLFALKRQLKL